MRVSKTTLLWIKRGAMVVGALVAILATIALLKAFDSNVVLPKIDNPSLDAAAAAQ